MRSFPEKRCQLLAFFVGERLPDDGYAGQRGLERLDIRGGKADAFQVELLQMGQIFQAMECGWGQAGLVEREGFQRLEPDEHVEGGVIETGGVRAAVVAAQALAEPKRLEVGQLREGLVAGA